LLARGSVNLDAGFVVSDADPSVMPTLANVAAVLANYAQTVVANATSSNVSTATLTPAYPMIGQPVGVASETYLQGNNYPDRGGANLLAGQDPAQFLLRGDLPAQLIRDVANAGNSANNPYGAVALSVSPSVEAERHAGLHTGDSDPARIIALNGDVTQAGNGSYATPFEGITKATEVYAGRDVVNLALVGQNNNATDITSIIAGRDVIYPVALGATFLVPFAIEVGGPGNLVIEGGRNVDLGNSTGIQTFGNSLNPSLSGIGASIIIETGLGSLLTQPAYAAFSGQFVDPATASTNQYAEPLQLFDASGTAIGSGDQAYAYLQGLSPSAQGILLNSIFFGLVRDSGREHTGAAGGGNYELGFGGNTVDTVGALNDAYSSYQHAYAAIGTFFNGVSPGPYASGSFLGGLSTVRTQAGGNVTIMAPNGQIEVGLASPNFPGYSSPRDPAYALNFGAVTKKGGDVALYAYGNISVDQSRVFTLEGGDITAVSRTGNIDAGKGSKTVQAIQPPNVSYNTYGQITITPYGPASGSGIAVLRALPDVPLSNADLIAFQGVVNAGDAGIRVSGNINLAAVAVINASNITVGGAATGIPVVNAPNVGALTTANNASGAAATTASVPTQSSASNQPSIIIVEVIGYGGDETEKKPRREEGGRLENEQLPKQSSAQGSYDAGSAFHVIGNGRLTDELSKQLSDKAKSRLDQMIDEGVPEPR
jgi:hypothetical protein